MNTIRVAIIGVGNCASSPIPHTDTESRALTDKFIRRYGKKGRGARKPTKKAWSARDVDTASS